MAPTKKILVNDVEITISEQKDRDDYICLTDMVKAKGNDNGRTDLIIQNWMRIKDTVEFLGLWESINNPDFNPVEFEGFRNAAGTNRFSLTAKEWIHKTNAIGILSKPGRYGGTYAHKDIAFEFGTWLSPAFKLYLIKEYQRLKEAESHPMLGEWNVKRILSKVNYTLHTDAVKSFVIPKVNVEQALYAYADEADILNLALWGCTAKQWREANPTYAAQGMNVRDTASINELVVLSNLESLNAELLKREVSKSDRFRMLHRIATEQLHHLNAIEADKKFKAIEHNEKNLLK